jgi:hypothetical protein
MFRITFEEHSIDVTTRVQGRLVAQFAKASRYADSTRAKLHHPKEINVKNRNRSNSGCKRE